MGKPLKVGVVGCGNISSAYLTTLTPSPWVDVVAVTDLDPARAAQAAQAARTRAVDPDEIYTLDGVEWILNLTTPARHATVSLTAIAHGRSVYAEKPLCSTVAEAREVLAAAHAAGVHVAGAPDTVLGTGVQTARAALESGLIGTPVAATATMNVPGHELWHPDPGFYYAPGGGPLLDMGPYYLSALVHLLGPVAAVYGAGRRTRQTRTIASGPRAGEQIPVDVDSHVTAILEHATGALSTLVMSFDATATRAASIEVHGEHGSLEVPDPNGFDGQVRVHLVGGQWQDVAPAAGYAGSGRGLGLIDIARSPDRATARADAGLAFHVLDVMETTLASVADGRRHEVASTCTRPAPIDLTTDLTTDLDTRLDTVLGATPDTPGAAAVPKVS